MKGVQVGDVWYVNGNTYLITGFYEHEDGGTMAVFDCTKWSYGRHSCEYQGNWTHADYFSEFRGIFPPMLIYRDGIQYSFPSERLAVHISVFSRTNDLSAPGPYGRQHVFSTPFFSFKEAVKFAKKAWSNMPNNQLEDYFKLIGLPTNELKPFNDMFFDKEKDIGVSILEEDTEREIWIVFPAR